MLSITFALLLVVFTDLSQPTGEECVVLLIVPEGEPSMHLSDVRDGCFLSEFGSQDEVRLITAETQSEVIEIFASTITKNLSQSFADVIEGICSRIIGVVGNVDSKTASILHTLASRSNLTITIVAGAAPSTFLPVTNLALPNVLDMNPLLHYVEATVSFIDQYNWTRIGLISDDSHYYQYAAEMLHKTIKENALKGVIISPHLTIPNGVSGSQINNTLDEFKKYDIHVTVIMMNQISVCSLLEKSKESGLVWPSYVWIVPSFKPNGYPIVCDIQGTFVLHHSTINCLNRNTSYNQFKELRRCFNTSSEQFGILQDSLSTVHLSARVNNEYNSVSFCGETGLVQFRNGQRLRNISIDQTLNSSKHEIACYDTQLRKLNSINDLETYPQDNTEPILNQSSPLHIAFVVMVFALSVAFLVVIFCLYVYFRNEPEIKATSFSVSLSIFLGSFCLLFQVLLVLLDAQPATNVALPANLICFLLAWLSAIGLPVALILSAILVKMLRVYAIFSDPFSYQKKFCTDFFLFLYILCLISPSVLILLIWSIVDPLTNHEIVISTKSHDIILEECSSDHIYTWAFLSLAYLIVLVFIVVVIAFKTASIRYKHFKDTKATNAFAFLTVFSIINTLFYWLFFDDLEESVYNFRAAELCLYAGHVVTALLCPIFLFAPKVFHPLKRCLCSNTVTVRNKNTVTVRNKK